MTIDKFHQAKVNIALARAIPKGMCATVHLAWFDPQNEPPRTTTASLWQFDPNGDGNKKKDNIGVLSISPTTLEFTNKDNLPNNGAPTKYTVASFLEGFGDNFIVAAHPNAGIVEKYVIRTRQQYIDSNYYGSIDQMLMYPTPELNDFLGGNYALVPTSMQTKILYNAAWNGFKVPETWGIHEIVDQNTGKVTAVHIKTPLPTGPSDPNTGEPRSNNDNNITLSNCTKSPVSVLDFDCNFHMAVDFDYYGPTYIQGIRPNGIPVDHKRTFHRNSGVFIYNLIEMQIFDTKAMLDLGNEIVESPNKIDTRWQAKENPEWESNAVRRETTDVAVRPAPALPVPQWESISGCVTGIPYLAQSWHNKTLADLDAVKNRTSLNFTCTLNKTPVGAAMQVTSATIVSAGETFANLEYGTGGDRFKTKLEGNTNWKIYLQSHWGSGVAFHTITLTKQ